MSYPPLKKQRLSACMTQTQVAEAMGVSQPNYQRWESGAAPIPANKIKKLAKILETTVDDILGKPKPFDFFGIDDSIEDTATYYGTVAIHFSSGASALLFPISVAMRDSLHNQLKTENGFIIAHSLDNQIVYIRRCAISDVYFSSDACDDNGPEAYDDYLGVFPDEDFWQIAEWADTPEAIKSEHTHQRIQEVIKEIRSATDEMRVQFSNRAKNITWQLSSGARRQEYSYDNLVLYDAFSLINTSPYELDEPIYLPLSGYHRSIFINKAALDYITIPAHKYAEGQLESDQRDTDGI